MCWSAHVLFIATVAPHFSEECAERLFKRVDDALAAGQRIVYGGKAVSLGVGVKVDRSQKPKTTGNADSVAVSSVDSEKEEGMAAASDRRNQPRVLAGRGEQEVPADCGTSDSRSASSP